MTDFYISKLDADHIILISTTCDLIQPESATKKKKRTLFTSASSVSMYCKSLLFYETFLHVRIARGHKFREYIIYSTLCIYTSLKKTLAIILFL